MANLPKNALINWNEIAYQKIVGFLHGVGIMYHCLNIQNSMIHKKLNLF